MEVFIGKARGPMNCRHSARRTPLRQSPRIPANFRD